MGMLPVRQEEIDKEKPIVVMCYAGVRLAQVCQYLESLGYNVKNLKKGGGDAWFILVDSTEPRY